MRTSALLRLSDHDLEVVADYYNHPALPDTWRRIDPLVVETALRLAGGDVRRLTTDDGSSLVVWNHPRW